MRPVDLRDLESIPMNDHRRALSSGSSSSFHFFNSKFGDTTLTKVFVGGLAWETHSEALRRHFERFGEILEAVVISDKATGRSKGYGFVTFCDAESAMKACEDPNPEIDGRRANCNLASVGRPRPTIAYAHPGSAYHLIRGVPVPQGAFVGSPTYQQSVPYNYQQAIPYPPYGYMSFGPEHVHSQNPYDPYMRQQYYQVYGIPGTMNSATYPFGQLAQPLPTGHGYPAAQSYTMQGPHLMQASGTSVSGITTTPLPAIQPPYPTGSAIPFPAQPHFVVPGNSPQFINSNRTTDWRST